MSIVKPFFDTYKSYDGSIRQVRFQCTSCNSDKCFRPKYHYNLTFFEGSFKCLGCKKEVSYSDYDFISRDINKQYELFN